MPDQPGTKKQEVKSFYERVKEAEQVLLRTYAGAPKNQEDFDAYLEKCRNHNRPNRIEHLEGFYKFLSLVADKPFRSAALPFFEVSWLLSGIGQDGLDGPEAAAELIRQGDRLTGKTLTRDFKITYAPLISMGEAVSERAFRRWVKDAREGKPAKGIKVRQYRKLVQMITHISRRFKNDRSFWTDAAMSVCPAIKGEIIPFPEELSESSTPVRVSVTGNVGTEASPIYMPFISVNFTGVIKRIKGILEDLSATGEMTTRLANSLYLPIVNTHLMMHVSGKISVSSIGEIPALKLMEVLEVSENRMRGIGNLKT